MLFEMPCLPLEEGTDKMVSETELESIISKAQGSSIGSL